MNSSKRRVSELDLFIGEQLRKIRTNRDMTQTNLAAEMDVSFQQIQKYEKGANRISAVSLFRMSKYFGVDVNYFYEGYEETEAFMHEQSEKKNLNDLNAAYEKIENPEKRKFIIDLIKSYSEKSEED